MSTIELSTNQLARLGEIERRYERHDVEQKANRRKRYSVCALRLGELYKFARDKWGRQIPDDDDGRVFVRVVVNTLAGLVGDPSKRIASFVDLWAPWLDEDELDEIVELAELSLTQYSADAVARAIGLDLKTRTHLKIRTIGAVDRPKAARVEDQRVKHREREAARRARNGAKPRKFSLTATSPWDGLGISKSTFYRHRELYEAMSRPADQNARKP